MKRAGQLVSIALLSSIISPGSISTLGVVEYDFTLPPNLPQGLYFFGQATVVHQGTTYRTASQVVLVQ